MGQRYRPTESGGRLPVLIVLTLQRCCAWTIRTGDTVQSVDIGQGGDDQDGDDQGSDDEGADRYPWVAMGVVIMGTFMVILDTTIVNVALPQIGIALDNSSGVEWIVTAYLLAVGVAQPPTGWLADRYGRKALFIGGVALFAAGSLMAALSPSLGILVVARVVQGLGGGAVLPVGMAMVYELFPPDRRGTALGIWGVAAMAAPAFGPVIGGYLVTAVSWHWLFLINVPVGAITVIVALRLLRDTGYREVRRFDKLGLGLITVALVSWLYTFARAGEWGWTSARTVILLVIGALFLAAFIVWERRVDQPAIDVAMFAVPIFDLTLLVIAATVVVQYSILVFLPLRLEILDGMTALRVGTMLVPMALGAAITFPLGGRLNDRIGPRIPVMVGTLLLGSSAWILGHMGENVSTVTIEVAVVLQGLGFGFAMMPNSVTGLNSLPRRFVAQASGVRQLNVRVSASFGVAVLASIIAGQVGGLSPVTPAGAMASRSAYNHAFVIAAVLGGVACVLALFLPGSERNRELMADRAAENPEFIVDV